ncbi:MAG: putative serine protease PepD [Acidimicrobiales bacterium]|jgi:putative serine protease PepD
MLLNEPNWEFESVGKLPPAPSRLPPVPPPSGASQPRPPARPSTVAPVAPPAPASLSGSGPPIVAEQTYAAHFSSPRSDTLEVPPVGPSRPPTHGELLPAAGPVAAAPRWGWRALLAFLAGGVLTAAGFGVAQISDNDPAVVTVATDVTETQPTTTVGATSSPPVIVTDEPIAYVAQLLGPSVVQIETNIGLGSGVIYGDGLILTNHHVVENASQVRVRLPDGRTLEATIVGSNPRTDIAVVAAGEGLGLPAAKLAVDDPLEVGELTVAIGSPFQLQQTVTSGIVSAVNRPIFNGTGWNAMVQTDAAINPGNSGGALANRAGEVIGINTAIQTDGVSQSNAGIGFAMPITTAAQVAQRIVDGQPLEPGFLGVQGIQPVSGEIGVEIGEVTPGSAAQAAGLMLGDIVLSIDGAPVTAFEQLAGLVQTSFPGDEIELQLTRASENLTIRVVLGER